MSVFGASLFVQPTSTEVALAERALLHLLSDGTARLSPTLVAAAIAMLGGPPTLERLIGYERQGTPRLSVLGPER